MAQYTINSQYASLIALDTHARTTTAKGIDLETGITKVKRFNDCPSPAEIASWIKSNFSGPHYCAYESGCTGFYLCRELRNLDIDCDVIAVSSIARSSDDKKRKDDRRDAKRLLNELLVPSSSLSRVWIPDEQCEGIRDLLRCYRDGANALKRLKQQLLALLLRHGYVFNEKTSTDKNKKNWSKAFDRWLDLVDLGTPEANETLTFYRSAITENSEYNARMRTRIEKVAETSRWKPYVDAFCCIKGIEVYSALVYASEFGDFSRFKNGRSASMYVGVTPKSHASGNTQIANGHITKSGNSQLRVTFVEGCSSLSRRKYAPVKVGSDQIVSERIISACNSCNKRLINRHRHLTEDLNKKANVAKIAIVNEMVRWVWAVGCMVQEEQQGKAR